MIDLNNNMSYVIGDVMFGYWPKKYVQFSVVLVPTPGAIAVDPDTLEDYGINRSIYYGTAHEPEKTICLALLGKGTNVLKQWMLSEFAKYKVNPETSETQLRSIFDSVVAVGTKE
jgi:hypothetical protein